MDALTQVRQDHRKLEGLLERCEQLDGDDEERDVLLGQLQSTIRHHVGQEESLLYTIFRERARRAEIDLAPLDRAVEQHRLIDRLSNELTDGGPRVVDEIEAGVTFVDGLGVGDVKDVALRDRRRLSEDGVLIIVATLAPEDGVPTNRPELIARGFAGAHELIEETRDEAARVLDELLATDVSEIKLLQEHLHDEVGQLVYDRTHRRPMILPVVVEV